MTSLNRQRQFAALIAMLVLTSTAYAQQTEGMLGRAFDAAMQRAAPNFRLQPQSAGGRGQPDVYTWWMSNGRRVSLRYFVSESAESASQQLQERVSLLPIPTKRIEGLGDEAYLLAPSNPTGQRGIWLRKSAVVLEVAAPGEDGVRRFAALFANAVDLSALEGASVR